MRGVAGFEIAKLNFQRVDLITQVINRSVRAAFKVLVLVVHTDDIVFRGAESATCVIKVLAHSVEFAAQRCIGLLQRIVVLLQRGIFRDEAAANDACTLRLSIGEGTFAVQCGRRIMTDPYGAGITRAVIVGDNTEHGVVTPWPGVCAARVRSGHRDALRRRLGILVKRHIS